MFRFLTVWRGVAIASLSTRISSCAFPKSLPLDAAAPFLCAGITTYAPMKHGNVGPGKKSAIIGIGGIRETQEALDFCAQHRRIERQSRFRVNEAYEGTKISDVH